MNSSTLSNSFILGFIWTLCLIFENTYTLAFTSSGRNVRRETLNVHRFDSERVSLDDGIDLIPDNPQSGIIHISRRGVISKGVTLASSVTALVTLLSSSQQVTAADDTSFKPSVRATAYLVDSTKPPTLVPISKAREAAILKNLGNGLGTSKKPFVEDEINLNNMMNKGVFGTVDLVRNILGGDEENSKGKKKNSGGVTSFVFLGVSNYYALTLADNSLNRTNVDDDIQLAVRVISDIIKPRRGLDTAIGLDFAPQSTQEALDSYLKTDTESPEDRKAEEDLIQAMIQAQVARQIVESHLPVIRLAKMKRLNLVALAPEIEDVRLVRRKGLQNLDTEKRSRYVLDTEGFINSTQDPSFRLYADKSLLKDFESLDDKDQVGDYFAERILVHEAIASKLATYASPRLNSLVITIAPIKDVRFMGGPNKRITRVMNYIQPEAQIDEDAVTTILLNPSAKETLSLSRFLRLEIGTAPTLIPYQTKVADYLWFSSTPKVNMLPRMMNG